MHTISQIQCTLQHVNTYVLLQMNVQMMFSLYECGIQSKCDGEHLFFQPLHWTLPIALI